MQDKFKLKGNLESMVIDVLIHVKRFEDIETIVECQIRRQKTFSIYCK